MIIFNLNEGLSEVENVNLCEDCKLLVVANSSEAHKALNIAKIDFNGELNIDSVTFNKIEAQPECICGTLYVPKLVDIVHSRYKNLFFIGNRGMVIVDNDTFSINIIKRIRRQQANSVNSIQKFICVWFAQIMSRDTELLSQHEKSIMELEDNVSAGKIDHFLTSIEPIRKELLILRSYYDEICDMGKELEQDENGFFEKKQRKYFGSIFDRSDRLMNRTVYLLEYSSQVRDAYQSRIDAKQNGNMQFLTVISTIFYPLTLITGWYGMNFHNMPELEKGYPFVIILSLIVVTVCIIIFKIKKML